VIRPGRFGCLDAHLYDDERVAKLSGCGQSLFIAMTLYCSAELTDGRVPGALIPRLMLASKSRRRHLKELLELGLVERLGLVEGSGMADDYYLPAYLKWNVARAEVEAEREAARDRQRAHRERKQMERRLRAV